jgi:tRNA threonylcarbamoyladenosine biosynthesis protein TsaB
MLTLALDTTNEHGGVVVCRDTQCLGLVANQGPANLYSVNLFSMVDNLLRQAAIQLNEVDLFSVAVGPGSFTGIRVGIAAMQAWARAFARPVCGVSILEALVETAQPEEAWAVPILDAHRGEFYVDCLRNSGRLHAPKSCTFVSDGGGWVAKPHELKTIVENLLPAGAGVAFLVRGHDQAARTLLERFSHSFRLRIVEGPLVEAIARLGLEAHRRGRSQSPGELEAFYIRRSDAEMNWRG